MAYMAIALDFSFLGEGKCAIAGFFGQVVHPLKIGFLEFETEQIACGIRRKNGSLRSDQPG